MPLGDSKGAFYEDEFRMEAAPWFLDPKLDAEMVVDPKTMQINKELDKSELDPSTGMGIEIADRYSDAGSSSFKGGYLGVRPSDTENPDSFWFKDDWQNTWDSAISKDKYKNDPEGYLKKLGPDVEGFTTQDSGMMWLRRRAKPTPKLEDLMSSADAKVVPASYLEDRRSDTPNLDMNRLMDPEPLSKSIGGSNSKGAYDEKLIGRDVRIPSKLAKELGFEDIDRVSVEELYKRLGIEPIVEDGAISE